MNIETARRIFDEMARARDEELKLTVVSGAVRYAQIRVEWAQARSGEDNNWRGALGNDRQSIGDLASFLHLFLALSAR